MSKLSLKNKLGRAALTAALVGSAATALVVSSTGAGADPGALDAGVLKGVGSDTLQDVTNAYSGATNNNGYAPLIAASNPAGTLSQQMTSFDAVNPTSASNLCVTTKAGAGAILRPNGSGDGIAALSRTVTVGSPDTNSHSWGKGSAPAGTACNNKDPRGLVDFARSSSGPGNTGTDLDFVPFARDAVSFAYATNAPTAVTSLTSTQLQEIYALTGTGAHKTVNAAAGQDVDIYPCGIQTSSGTFKFWNTALGATSTEANATATCNTVGGNVVRLEENNMTSLINKLTSGAAFDTTTGNPVQVIVGFSGGSFIAQSNGVAKSTLPTSGTTKFGVGSIDGNAPQNGAPGSMTPDSVFYASTTYGRNLYYVVDHAKITSAGNTNLALKNMFASNTAGTSTVTIPGLAANHTASICTTDAQDTAHAFGFLSLANCGAVGPFHSSVTNNPS